MDKDNRQAWIMIIALFGAIIVFGLLYYIYSSEHGPGGRLLQWVYLLCALATGAALLWERSQKRKKPRR